jgi:polar amino acid transport system permease protein
LAFSGGMFFGLILASIKTFGNLTLRRIVIFYVTFFTNTPQLVQIYFLFFALPEIGILLSPFVAVLIGMTLNAAAYMCEIQRAGFLSIRQNELDAARTMSFSIVQQVRFVILPHIMKVLFPPLSNHYILMTLGTSMAAIFGVEELTGRAFNINSETFRSVEIFSITALVYIIITFIATLLLAIIGKYFFKAKIRIIQ